MNYNTLPQQETIEVTKSALEKNGFKVILVEKGTDARSTVEKLVPKNSEIMTMTSQTLEKTGIAKDLNESGNYQSVRKVFANADNGLSQGDKNKLGAAPEYTVGSVHAITQDGHLFIASNTGSQLAAYAYGAEHVIFVVGAQKLVHNDQEALKRIYEYTLPLESKRAHEAYGVAGSAVNKLLIINAEIKPDRITVIIVKEEIGF